MIQYSSPCMALFNDLIDYSLILDWINISQVSVLLSGVVWFWMQILSRGFSKKPYVY